MPQFCAMNRPPWRPLRHYFATATAPRPSPSSLLQTLRDRQLLQDCTSEESFLDSVADPRGAAYLGIDPTAPSLHLGHLVALRLLMELRGAGLRTFVVLGGVTASIGDPTGRSIGRSTLELDAAAANAQRMRAQLQRLLGRCAGEVELLDNSAWLGQLTVPSLLHEVGRFAKVKAMLGKETMKERLKSGLTFAEFAYPLMQGYDWVHLAREHRCALQVGGSDQWGNITEGVEMVGRATGLAAVGVTCPLLVDGKGQKFGKSTGNALWADAAATSSFELYQQMRRLDAKTAGRLLRQLSQLDLAEIELLEAAQTAAPGKGAASAALARDVVTWLHGSKAADVAVAATRALYQSGSITGVSVDELAGIMRDSGAPVVALQRTEALGHLLVDLAAQSGLCFSKSDAKRLQAAGGMYVNDRRVEEGEALQSDELAEGRALLLRAGKRKVCMLLLDA